MTRNERIVEAYKSHSLEQVGKMFGITRERVRQIVKKVAPDFKKVIEHGLKIPQELLDAYVNKKIKLRELAKKLNACNKSVSESLKKHGAKVYRSKDYLENRDSVIVEKYKQMMSLQEIADEMGIPLMTAQRAIKRRAPEIMRSQGTRKK